MPPTDQADIKTQRYPGLTFGVNIAIITIFSPFILLLGSTGHGFYEMFGFTFAIGGILARMNGQVSLLGFLIPWVPIEIIAVVVYFQ